MESLHSLLRTGSPTVAWRDLQAALAVRTQLDGDTRRPGASLQNRELWKRFYRNTNEMIVNKVGRRMFPALQVALSSLEPSALYAVLLEFQSTHGHRWRFVNGEWQSGSSAVDAPDQRSVHVHPNSPATGAKWMQESITFTKFKLSNKENGNGKIKLSSLHQYQPCIHIVRLPSSDSTSQQLQITSHSFEETQFIAVTTYQNEKITKTKIRHNPFAKAFLSSQETESYHSDGEEQVDPPTHQTVQVAAARPAGSRLQCSMVDPPTHQTVQVAAARPAGSRLQCSMVDPPTHQTVQVAAARPAGSRLQCSMATNSLPPPTLPSAAQHSAGLTPGLPVHYPGTYTLAPTPLTHYHDSTSVLQPAHWTAFHPASISPQHLQSQLQHRTLHPHYVSPLGYHS